MKKLALALVFGVLSMGAVSAQTVDKLKVKKDGKEVKTKQEIKGDKVKRQEAKTPTEQADRTVKRLTQELGLNTSQTTQIRELSLVKAQQMEALRAKKTENKAEMKAEMEQLRTTYTAGLQSILTAEQIQKFQTMQVERQAKMKAKHDEHKNNGTHKGH